MSIVVWSFVARWLAIESGGDFKGLMQGSINLRRTRQNKS